MTDSRLMFPTFDSVIEIHILYFHEICSLFCSLYKINVGFWKTAPNFSSFNPTFCPEKEISLNIGLREGGVGEG